MCVCCVCLWARASTKKTYEEVTAEAEKQRLLVALCKCPRQKIAVHAAAGAASVWFSKGDAVKCNLFFWTQRVDVSLDLNIYTHTTTLAHTYVHVLRRMCALSFCHSIPLFVSISIRYFIFYFVNPALSSLMYLYTYINMARTRLSNQP